MKNLSNSEKAVLEVICELKEPVTARELQRIFEERGTDWKIQTVSTLLTRLEDKGAIRSEKIKHVKYYSPKFNTLEITGIEAKRFIKDVFGGSLSNFFVALTDGAISDEKAKELELWIKEQQEDN
ncbi:MAG: BlaI/MecI/CopY family transcriptional regulator [Butyrivibrio sp.]|nr:BlaI/MecI/CopY family transcriptional regulator [Butyrivibrio sp.]